MGRRLLQTAHAAGAAVDGDDGDFAAGDADVKRGMSIGAGHADPRNRAAPPSPQIAAGWGYNVFRRPPAEVADAMPRRLPGAGDTGSATAAEGNCGLPERSSGR